MNTATNTRHVPLVQCRGCGGASTAELACFAVGAADSTDHGAGDGDGFGTIAAATQVQGQVPRPHLHSQRIAGRGRTRGGASTAGPACFAAGAADSTAHATAAAAYSAYLRVIR